MKTIFIITQRFYPDPAVGAVRMTQWAKMLPKHGWKPIIVCQNDGFSITREEIANLIHREAEVIYLNDPPNLRNSLEVQSDNWLRSLAIRIFGTSIVGSQPRNFVLKWTKEVVRKIVSSRGKAAEEAFWLRSTEKITDLVKIHKPQAVITTSPTAGTHAVGLQLKKKFPDIQWIADFRDVFRQGGRYRVGLLERCSNRKSLQSETAIYLRADQIICTIPAHQRWIKQRFVAAANKTTLVFNGAPEELCERIRDDIYNYKDNFVKVVGFSEAKESVFLAQAVLRLRQAGEDIELSFVGKFPSVKSEVERVLGDGVVFTGSVPHLQALEEIVSARVLVAVLSENRSRVPAIASKLFEYLAVPTPVVILNPSNSARIMFSRLPGVWMLTKPTPDDIAVALSAALNASEAEMKTRALMVQESWSRRSQVAQLASILDGLCGSG